VTPKPAARVANLIAAGEQNRCLLDSTTGFNPIIEKPRAG
jgi:hypothetical protein